MSATGVSDSAISVSWAASAAELPAELWQAAFSAQLEGRWWYETLERSGLEQQFTFSYACIGRDGAPIGIAPVFLMDVPIDLVAPPIVAALLKKLGAIIPRARYQRTLFVGSPCSDEGTIGLLPGVELADIIASLTEALETRAREARASMIVWKDMPAEYAEPLTQRLPAERFFKVTSYPGTRVKLGANMNAYLEGLSSSHRHNLKKKLKRSREIAKLSYEVIERPSALVLNEVILPLFWQTYERGVTKFEKLTAKFFEYIAEQPASHFVLVREESSGALVAFMLCFRLGTRVINKFIGIDYRRDPKWFLYFRLWEAALEWALKEGAAELQSGQTGYRAKIDVGHALVPLDNYCRHRNPLLHRIFAMVARTINWRTLDEDLKIYLEAHPEAARDSSRLPKP